MSSCSGRVFRGYSILAVVACAVPLAAGQRTSKPAKKGALPARSTEVLARVDGEPITRVDLDRTLLIWQVPEAARAEAERKFLDRLIDARLMKKYLAGRKLPADQQTLDEQVARLRRLAESGPQPEQARVLLDSVEPALREELGVGLAWKAHVARTVTEKQLRDHFDEHRSEFDGTQVRASHIILKVKTDEESPALAAARRKLTELRAEILAGKITFEEAARAHSEAPSREQGGDVGDFPWHGKMPAAFCRVAFGMKVGDLSAPITTPFGVHLCLVTDRKPGDLSLEDAREDILARLSDELWAKTATELRRKAKIERKP